MSDQLRVPLTADQKRLIAEAAELDAIEMTAWARSVLIQAARNKVRTEVSGFQDKT